ncbi:MAG: hypothetical protein G01um101466_460 [Parcubacteria group bacterium Gr01-1014_66]|nr:MAG: hypothetical protein G01um101466_460 [Parcubacteria group bacterium Gr01-1014_66]
MDILEQYEKQNSEASSRVPQWEPSDEYGGLTRVVIRLFRGRIQNEKQANTVLIALAVCMFVITIIILFGGGGGSPEAFTPKGQECLSVSMT